MYNIISSGSQGNAIIYHGTILLDCGVPYSLLKPYVKDLKLVLLTHEHKDHINIRTLNKLRAERPTLRIGGCEHMKKYFEWGKNYDLYEIGKLYDYGQFKISPVQLYHDVPNVGYRIFKGEHKLIHATDTQHLLGITAKHYDLFMIESNYNSETIWDTIKALEQKGEYAYMRGSINSHLSEQQCNEFYYANKGEHSQLVRLHQTKTI